VKPLYTNAWGENNVGIAETDLNALETRLVYQCHGKVTKPIEQKILTLLALQHTMVCEHVELPPV